jgi:hypothetical protein
MFPDVLAGNGADIVRGILDVLGQNFLVVGGAAGDDFNFEKTYQYLNGEAHSGSVVGVGIAGNLKFGIGVKHGWFPLGAPMKATKARGSVLYELDGKPAINIYRDYFGEEEARRLEKETLAKLAITYPLGIRVNGNAEMLLRDPLTVDPSGAITCTAEIPQGAEVRLMIGSREEAVKATRIAAKNAVSQLEGVTPRAVIVFSCIARNKLFGERSGEEITAIRDIVGKNIPIIGFYTYGEQAPFEGNPISTVDSTGSVFHNETVVICIFGE